jgi:hypothetical protein
MPPVCSSPDKVTGGKTAGATAKFLAALQNR